MKKKTFLIILIIFLNINTYCQDWVRIYGDYISAYPYDLIETYDKGYMIAGKINQGEIPKYGWLIKTDVNGEILWDKKFGDTEYGSLIHSVSQTKDGGYIILGGTRMYDLKYDPFIIKLNACGEKEWCKIFCNPNDYDFGMKIKPLSSGGYIAMIDLWGSNLDKRIWLFRLDEQGNIIWKKVYAQQDVKITNEDCYDLTFFQDSSFLITGECYYPNPGDTNNYYWERPFFIKVDTTGEEIWTLPWGKTDYFYGHAASSVIDKKGNIYSVGRHARINHPPWGDSPFLIKSTPDGQECFYKDLLDSTDLGQSRTINWFGDSSLVITAGWRQTHDDDIIQTIFKVDTSGNIIKKKEIIVEDYMLQDGVTTFDNKIVLVGGFYWGHDFDIYAYKFNQDLEYDSIYTQAYTYDSLCPYGIASDTISLDTTTVNLDELWIEMQGGIKIIPNPAKDKLRIEIKNSKVISLSSLKSKQNIIEFYDIYARKVKQITLPLSQEKISIDISTWHKGMYLAKLINNGKTVATAKILKE